MALNTWMASLSVTLCAVFCGSYAAAQSYVANWSYIGVAETENGPVQVYLDLNQENSPGQVGPNAAVKITVASQAHYQAALKSGTSQVYDWTRAFRNI